MIKIHNVTEKENKLIGRKEFLFGLDFDGKTPTTEEVKAEFVALKKSNPALTKIKHFGQTYGVHSAKVLAYIYDTDKDFKINERIVRKVRRENNKKLLEARKANASQKQAIEESNKNAEAKKAAAPAPEVAA